VIASSSSSVASLFFSGFHRYEQYMIWNWWLSLYLIELSQHRFAPGHLFLEFAAFQTLLRNFEFRLRLLVLILCSSYLRNKFCCNPLFVLAKGLLLKICHRFDHKCREVIFRKIWFLLVVILFFSLIYFQFLQDPNDRVLNHPK